MHRGAGYMSLPGGLGTGEIGVEVQTDPVSQVLNRRTAPCSGGRAEGTSGHVRPSTLPRVRTTPRPCAREVAESKIVSVQDEPGNRELISTTHTRGHTYPHVYIYSHVYTRTHTCTHTCTYG